MASKLKEQNMADIINEIDGKVQVIFEKGEGTQIYRDAIWMTQSEYESTSSEAIDMIKQERYDNWLIVVNSLPTEEIVSEITEEFVTEIPPTE
jgi:hypothetical protein